MLERGLGETAVLWEPVERAYGWVYAAAQILDNSAELDGAHVRRRFQGLLGAMQRWRAQVSELQPAIIHFHQVTRSYWPGLFHCYDVPDLPRTNNDLEHLFGAHRHQERRISGRKTTAPSLVLQGPVRIVAALATRQRPFPTVELVPEDPQAWRALRDELDERRQMRLLQRRFRRDPEAYLASLEAQLVKSILPP